MPCSLLRWSIVLLLMCLFAPPASAGAEPRRPASQQAQKPPSKKRPAQKKPRKSPRLVRISGGELLRHDAAAAFEQMYSSAREAGLFLWVISGHRSWAKQQSLYRLYRKGLGPRAARPGRSHHQRGTAADISVGGTHTRTYEWLATHACRFGFRRTVRSEPWHWEYRPRTARPPPEGQDCLGRPLEAPAAPPSVSAPSPNRAALAPRAREPCQAGSAPCPP